MAKDDELTKPEVSTSEATARRSMRAESPRTESESEAAARIRAAEILENMDGTEGGDDFVAPPAPAGWTYEWKRRTVYNQEDPAYNIQLRRTGWQEVPLSRHPEMMPFGWKGAIIERKGMVLMERPQEVTNRFKERDRQLARNQVRAKEEQLSAAPPGTFERANKDSSMARIKKGYEPLPVPEK